MTKERRPPVRKKRIGLRNEGEAAGGKWRKRKENGGRGKKKGGKKTRRRIWKENKEKNLNFY